MRHPDFGSYYFHEEMVSTMGVTLHADPKHREFAATRTMK